ncbi:MAG: 30S ribosomal protein S13 [Chloroflexi bacterium]|nr:30S ribosomal protein S13 [Chloroflexota bacterium]
MPRVAGVDIPNDKKIDVALRAIYGVGPTIAIKVAQAAQISPESKVRDLSEEELNRVRDILDKQYIVEGDLRRQVQQNLRRLVEINSYRGIRHRRGLPVRGQRTKTNARTKRGARKTVAGRRQVRAKK